MELFPRSIGYLAFTVLHLLCFAFGIAVCGLYGRDISRASKHPDGYADDDGCPDLDNDGDGVPDLTDQCPNTPGQQDQEPLGCPLKPALVVVTDCEVKITQQIHFEYGSATGSSSMAEWAITTW